MSDVLNEVLAPDPRVPDWVYPYVDRLRDAVVEARRDRQSIAHSALIAAYPGWRWMGVPVGDAVVVRFTRRTRLQRWLDLRTCQRMQFTISPDGSVRRTD